MLSNPLDPLSYLKKPDSRIVSLEFRRVHVAILPGSNGNVGGRCINVQ